MRLCVAGLVAFAALSLSGCGGSGSTPPVKTTPTITWATPAAFTYGTALSSTQLNASAGSVAGAFTYSPAAGAILGAGSQTLGVTFTPSDTTLYNTATASVTITVTQATPTVTWATPAGITYGTALSSAQLNASAGSVAGTFSYAPSLGTVLAVGSQTLTATFTPTDAADYTTASASVIISVTKPATTLTWANPTPITYGTALSAAQLNATSNVPGVFVYTPVSGTVLGAGSQTLSVSFTPTDQADYLSATASVTLAINQAVPAITWASPAAIVVGTALGASQLDATANTPGSFTYTPPSGTAFSTPGIETLSVTFNPNDATDFTTAQSSVSLQVLPAAGTALVDFGANQQIIRGFGGSTAWMGTFPQVAINNLFGQTGTRVGMSLLRVRIDPTGSATNNSPWAAELGTAQEALAVAPDARVFASPWTPPAAYKMQTTAFQYYQGNPLYGGILDTAHYSDYANYLKSYVSYMSANGVTLYGVSMQNEPDWNATYEACNWNAAQIHTWVASYGNTLGAQLIMPESLNFNPAMSDPTLNDPNAVGKVGIVGGHLYGSAPAPYPLATSKGKELWMTEHAFNPAATTSSTYPLPVMSDAIAMAQEIHASMVTGGFNAYVWWWVYNWNPTINIGLIDANYNPTFYGYALGQYSRFVRPGYYRVSATSSPVAGVSVSAYSGDGHYVIVAINANATARLVPFFLENATVTAMTPYQTTSAGGLAQQSAVSVSGGTFTHSLPAQSIVTFVQ